MEVDKFHKRLSICGPDQSFMVEHTSYYVNLSCGLKYIHVKGIWRLAMNRPNHCIN